MDRILKNGKNILVANENSTVEGRKRKNLMKEERKQFERLLDEKLRTNFLRKSVNFSTVKKNVEDILESNPEYKEVMGNITFGGDYIYTLDPN